MDNELGDLVPDRIPAWLTETVRRAKGRDLSNYTPLQEYYKETEVVKSDRFDRYHYKGMRDQADELKELAMSRFEDDPTWMELIQDEYLGLYKAEPKKNKASDMKPTHQLNWAALDKAMSLRDWAELRTYTELDNWSAAMATVEFGLKLGELFDEMKELKEAQDKLNNVDKKIADLLEQIKEKGTSGQLDDASKLIDKLEKMLQDYQNAINGMDNAIKSNSNEIRQAAKQAAQEAREDAEGVADMLEAFGTEPGALSRMPSEARMELARRIQRNRQLKDLADKVGRFVRLALGEQARKIIHGTDEVHDVVLGNDLNGMLASELVSLAHPKLRREFYRKYAERSLLQYELRGTEKVARGAIICMIDSSGSMGGSKEVWAKAVGIALLNIAAKQGRDFHGIIFGSRNEIKEFNFPKGKGTPGAVLDFAEFAFMGGTDFMAPISRAVQVLERQYNDEGSQKGDLVLITDGICAVSDDWMDKYRNSKDHLAFRFYSCLIGVHAPILEALSDQIYNITELAHGTNVTEMFGYV